MNFSGSFHTVEYDMEAVSTVVFRISNPQYSFALAGSEHGRQSVARLQILQWFRGNREDYALGDFEYIVRTIVEIRFQKFRFVMLLQALILSLRCILLQNIQLEFFLWSSPVKSYFELLRFVQFFVLRPAP